MRGDVATIAQATGVGVGAWREALDGAIAGAGAVEAADITFLFAHSSFAPHFGEIAATANEKLGAKHVIGCAGQGLIATGREIEHEPAIVVMSVRVPNGTFTPIRLEAGRPALPIDRPDGVTAWLLFGDPYTLDGESTLERFNEAYPGLPVIGGMASANEGPRNTAVFLDGIAYPDGAVAIAIGGDAGIHITVSQGCLPIGQPWIITSVRDNLIETIAGRPAVEMLTDTLRGLDEETRRRAQANLLVGLAMDEYRDQHGMGDFLIRNLLGYEKETGALAISALPQSGQTVQFQYRDARAAGEHLRQQLLTLRERMGGAKASAALLCSCNGRGSQLFGPIDHDPTAIAEAFGDIPVAGLFCAGEIGPVGARNFLHGFTATIALFSERPTGS
jgi:small ligand-binding sensory domain FIST